jgi:hypothetical protein
MILVDGDVNNLHIYWENDLLDDDVDLLHVERSLFMMCSESHLYSCYR